MPKPNWNRARRRAAAAAVLAAGAVLIGAAIQPGPEVAYPAGFRAWTHVTSGVISPGSPAFDHFGGLHSIYANRPALEGYRTGQFPDGSMLAFDVVALAEDAASHTSTPGQRRLVDVMVKDSALYGATGGWGYGEFKGSSRTERTLTQVQAVTACHSCHQKAVKTDSVFSHILGREAMPQG